MVAMWVVLVVGCVCLGGSVSWLLCGLCVRRLFEVWYGDLCLLVGLRLSGADAVSGGFGGRLNGGLLG